MNSSKSSKQFSKLRVPFREDFQLSLLKHFNSSHFHKARAGQVPVPTQTSGADAHLGAQGMAQVAAAAQQDPSATFHMESWNGLSWKGF